MRPRCRATLPRSQLPASLPMPSTWPPALQTTACACGKLPQVRDCRTACAPPQTLIGRLPSCTSGETCVKAPAGVGTYHNVVGPACWAPSAATYKLLHPTALKRTGHQHQAAAAGRACRGFAVNASATCKRPHIPCDIQAALGLCWGQPRLRHAMSLQASCAAFLWQTGL